MTHRWTWYASKNTFNELKRASKQQSGPEPATYVLGPEAAAFDFSFSPFLSRTSEGGQSKNTQS